MLLSLNGTDGAGKTLTVFYCVHLTGRDRGNTGIQRVTRNLGAALQDCGHVDVVPVRWCAEKETIVYAEQHFCDVLALHNGPVFTTPKRPGEPIVKDNPLSCLLIPEVPHLGSHDERYPSVLVSKLIGNAKTRGLKTAVVFHDLLPLTHSLVDRPGALTVSAFESYGFAISYADAIFPVSHSAEMDLRAWWLLNGVGEAPKCVVRALNWPEEIRQTPRRLPSGVGDSRTLDFVSVGTVCKRKNQIAAMRAFKAFTKRRPNLTSRLLVIGSIAPEVASQASYEASTSDGRILLLGYRSDEEASQLIKTARATVFVSLAEGFGLPVVESLWLGTPCLCSNVGSVAEIAAGGGCLAVDPSQPADIEDAFDRLACDDELLARLTAEIAARPVRTWEDYANSIAENIEAMHSVRTSIAQPERVPVSAFEKSYRGTW